MQCTGKCQSICTGGAQHCRRAVDQWSPASPHWHHRSPSAAVLIATMRWWWQATARRFLFTVCSSSSFARFSPETVLYSLGIRDFYSNWHRPCPACPSPDVDSITPRTTPTAPRPTKVLFFFFSYKSPLQFLLFLVLYHYSLLSLPYSITLKSFCFELFIN